MAWMAKRVRSPRFLLAAAVVAAFLVLALFIRRNQAVASPVLFKVPAINNKLADVQAMVLQAIEAQKKGQLPEAAALYEKVLLQEPKAIIVLLKLGEVYFKSGLPVKAEEAYLKALENGANDPDIYLYLGYIKESQGKLEAALEYYAKAELAASDNPVLYFNMGNVHAQLEHLDKALAYLKRAVIMNPEYMDAFVNLSIVSTRAEEYSDAQYYLEKAERLGYHAPVQYKEGLAAKLKNIE